jgi:lipoprotein signal peptidase
MHVFNEQPMIKRLLTLAFCLGIAIFSALAVRSQLQLNDLNGVQLISFMWLSIDLHYTINTCINFGIAGDEGGPRQLMFAGLALIISMGILIWSWRNGRLFTTIDGGLFSGGGLANAYERVAFGGVFDYLNVSATFYQNPYSLNLADFYIFWGSYYDRICPQS